MTRIKNAMSLFTAAVAVGLVATSAHAVADRCDIPIPTNGNVPCPSSTATVNRGLVFTTDISPSGVTGAIYSYGTKLEIGTIGAQAVLIDSTGATVRRKSDGLPCVRANDAPTVPQDNQFGKTQVCELQTRGAAKKVRIVVD